jgi:hypothetical protein
MDHSTHHVSNQTTDSAVPEKRPYTAPKLQDFGSIRSVTLGTPPPAGDVASGGNAVTEHT